jgi:drug/metabolite transporter (DMT)-like permease
MNRVNEALTSGTTASIFFDNGIVIMLEACFFFAVFDSLTKYLIDSFTTGEIVFVRFCFGAIMMLPSLLRQRSAIRSKDYFLLMLRALSGAGTFYLTLLAFRSGALSVTMVLFFTNPLWALFLGALFLKEHLTWERTLCVVTAIIGIAVLIRPWGEGIALSHLYGLAAGVLGGANSVMTRHLRARISSRVIYAFHCFVGTVISVPFLFGHVRIPALMDGTVLLIAAAFGLLGQVAMNHGFRFVRAAEGSTLLMVESILTAVVGIILFNEPFTLTFVAGATMILGSGIYLGLRTGNDMIDID